MRVSSVTPSGTTAKELRFSQEELSRAIGGDRGAQLAVMKGCSGMIRGLLFRLIGPSAELNDLQQSVFVNLLTSLHTVRDPQKVVGWVRRLCVNAATDYLRQQRHRRQPAEPIDWEDVSSPADLEKSIAARDSLQACHRVLERLSVSQRTAFVLRALGHSVDEIAEAMGAARSTTRLRLYYARKAFLKGIAKTEPEHGASR